MERGGSAQPPTSLSPRIAGAGGIGGLRADAESRLSVTPARTAGCFHQLRGSISFLGGQKGAFDRCFLPEGKQHLSLPPAAFHAQPLRCCRRRRSLCLGRRRPPRRARRSSVPLPGGSPTPTRAPRSAAPAGPAGVTAHGRAGVPGVPPPRPGAPSAGPRLRAVSLATAGGGGASMVGSGAERGGSGSARPGVTCGRRPRCCCGAGLGWARRGRVGPGSWPRARRQPLPGAAAAGAALRGSAGCRLSRAGWRSGVRRRAPAAQGMERAAEGSPEGVTAPQAWGTASRTASYFGILPRFSTARVAFRLLLLIWILRKP